MAGILSKWFPKLFADPAQVAFERKQRITEAVRKFEREVKNQERFVKDYLNQAVVNLRTGDKQGYEQVKKMISFSFSYRRRAQRGLNTLRLFSTMADQMEAYRGFCTAVGDITAIMGDAFTAADLSKVQQQLTEGMAKAETMEGLIDQMLSGFDASLEERLPEDLANVGVKSDDVDALIRRMAEDGDTLTEDKVAKAIAALEASK